MKTTCLALAGFCLLPFLAAGSTYTDSLDRLAVSDPEFVFYTNLENDFATAGSFLTETYLAYLSTAPEGVPPIPVDFNRLFSRLGLSGANGVIATSEAHPEFGFTNQMMVTFEEAPSGIFLLGGGSNQPFSIREAAPVDAQLVAEMNLNGTALFQLVRGLVIDLMGPLGEGMIDAQMNQPLFENGPTLADIVNRLNTRIQVALKPYSEQTGNLPPAMAIFDGLSVIHISDIADLLQQFAPMLQQTGFTATESASGTTWSFAMPAGPMPFSVFLQTIPGSNDLIVSFNEDSKEWFLGSGPKIGSSPAFVDSIAGLPDSGLSFWYSTEAMSRRQIENLDAQLPASLDVQPVFDVVKAFLLKYTGQQAGVSFLDGNSYRVTSYQPTSYKTNLALAGAIVPLGIASSYAASAEEAAEDAEAPDPATDPADDSSGEAPADPLPAD